jgi:putative chitinase
MTNFILTKSQLLQIIPGNPYVDHWYDALSQALPDYDINTPARIASFLAQCGHESGGFTAIKENLNYKAESLMKTWPSRFPNMDIANQYAHNQEAIANKVYASRMGNGDENSGDGYRFCGRGLIQLTGRANYQAFADSIGEDIDNLPAYLETFEGCVQSACWFWEANNLNQYADLGDILTMTKRINGGTLGKEDRTARYNHCLQVMGS